MEQLITKLLTLATTSVNIQVRNYIMCLLHNHDNNWQDHLWDWKENNWEICISAVDCICVSVCIFVNLRLPCGTWVESITCILELPLGTFNPSAASHSRLLQSPVGILQQSSPYSLMLFIYLFFLYSLANASSFHNSIASIVLLHCSQFHLS